MHRVLARFGFHATSIESVQPLAAGTHQHSLLVRAGGGAWVLKRQTSISAVRRLGLSQPLEARLAEIGFPVAPIQRAESGQTLVQDGAAHYSLHAWVSGRQAAIADRDRLIAQYPDLLGALASSLGALHQVSRELDLHEGDRAGTSVDRLLGSPRYAVRAIRRPRPLLSRWHALRLKRDKSEFDRWIIRAMPHVAESARRLARRSIAADVNPAGIGLIHNDVNWENLLFDDRYRLVALLDFDNATTAPWVIEVGAAAVVLAGSERSRVDEFVSAYEDAVGAQVDRDLVELAMTLKCTQSILNSINTYLGGNAGDLGLLSSWCFHLYESLQDLQG